MAYILLLIAREYNNLNSGGKSDGGNMKKSIILLVSLALIFGAVEMVSAIPYTDTHYANLLMRSGYSTQWTFNIGFDGFDPYTQDVTSASIRLNLADDSGCDFWEFANLSVGENRFFWEVNTGNTSFNVSSLVSLSDTGTVAARLTAILGDFWFKNATLHAEGTDPGNAAAPVPEPGTILLLGTGLMGLVVASRKKLKR
jgi:hypothetical protein